MVAGLSPRLALKRARSRSSAAMLTALTTSKKPHQIATGFDQSSHATFIGLPPRALPNAHESVIRPTYKARSSQTFGRWPFASAMRGAGWRESAGRSNGLGFMSRIEIVGAVPQLGRGAKHCCAAGRTEF